MTDLAKKNKSSYHRKYIKDYNRNIYRKLLIILVACALGSFLIWTLSYNLSHCRDGLFQAIFTSNHHSLDAKFYFFVLLGLSIIITQLAFIGLDIKRLRNKSNLD